MVTGGPLPPTVEFRKYGGVMIHNAIQNAYNSGLQAGFAWGIACGLFLAVIIKAAKIIIQNKQTAK
jgi:hypothetical protein